jgi:hypothetical protein
MDGGASAMEWILLGVLYALIATAALVAGAGRSRSGPPTGELPGWHTQAVALVAAAPALVSWLFTDAPVEAVLWWILLAPAATVVLITVVGTAWMVVARWPEFSRTPDPKARALSVSLAALLIVTAGAIPLTIGIAALVGSDLGLATVLDLTLAYATWHLIYAAVRRHAVEPE